MSFSPHFAGVILSNRIGNLLFDRYSYMWEQIRVFLRCSLLFYFEKHWRREKGNKCRGKNQILVTGRKDSILRLLTDGQWMPAFLLAGFSKDYFGAFEFWNSLIRGMNKQEVFCLGGISIIWSVKLSSC